MSGYILCQTKKAEVPYFIENISTNIYTLEELCYYLFHNLYLVDQSIMNQGLVRWIQEELKLPKLAARLQASVGKFSNLEDVLYPVFKEINYLTYEELKLLNGRIQQLDRESMPVRNKQKGDTLMENGMYVHAIQVYQSLLETEDLDEYREGLTCSVCHNLGCAYSFLFQMEKALEYFWKAYEAGYSQESLKTYLLAVCCQRSREEYDALAKELGAGEEILEEIRQKQKEFASRKKPLVDPEAADELLETLTREYHRGTGS